jgi:hypothetical protein
VELSLSRLAVALFALSILGCDDTSPTPTPPAPDLGLQEAIGQEFVAKRGCPTCHQSSKASDGTLSGQSTPMPGTSAYPANLTPDTATGLGGWADIEIVRAMRYGVDNQQAPLCPPMPHFDGTDPSQPFMTDVEANAIIAYLRSLPAVARTLPASQCPPLKPQPPVDMAIPATSDLAPSAQD